MNNILSVPILIHIGYPKALSKWCQRQLFISEFGFEKVMGTFEAQAKLIDPPVFNFNPENVKNFFQQRAKNKPNKKYVPVITSENLCGHIFCGGFNAKELADRIKMVFSNARILIIVREQQSMIRSLYSEHIAWGLPHSLKRFMHPIDPRLAPQFQLDYLKYDKLIIYYQALFGKQNVLVLPYELFKYEPEKFLQSLHKFSEIQMDLKNWLKELPIYEKFNPGRSMLYLHVQRFFNRMLIANCHNYTGWVKNFQRGYFLTQIFRGAARIIDPSIPGFLKDPFEKRSQAYIERETEGQFTDSNRRLSELIHMDLIPFGYDV